ncbi:MAG: D-Ala-D-Ala carboxypeptidase family metallohydrolase [Mycobacteriales bacterium]
MSRQTPDIPSGFDRRAFLRTAVVGGAAAVAGLAIAPLLTGTAAQAYPWTGTLQQGSTGPDVTELQIRVGGWAADSATKTYVTVDGDFGPATAAAVKRFQTAYGLSATGVVDAGTQTKLNALESTDGSTLHFDWSEFVDHVSGNFEGGKVDAATVKEGVRRLMYRLEAIRVKIGNKPMTVTSGFRSVAHNATIPGAATNSMHLYGVAADLVVSGVSNKTIYQKAETSGFSGLEAYTEDHQHVDLRIEYPYGDQAWWWQSGTV